ncbi:MAG: nicotinate (nicotinamide) nucleotide adenylyltransferase [Desulforhopalus sp.]|nr:nicotinate (nicotinamide) nucleotide adenylyltransferase [Desulforhopalus sp.]
MSRKRIGLLGGTFNPVHFGHLHLAEAAMRECNLDQVVFIPSALPPHKDETSIASFADRVAMLQKAGANENRFTCTTIEGQLPTPSYTIDTLRALEGTFPKDALIFFIIGIDAFLDLLTWKSYEEILRRVALVVAQRKGYSIEELYTFLMMLNYVDQGHCWQGRNGKNTVYLLNALPGDYSSTAIRGKLQKGVFSDQDVPGEVIEYIKQHNLYQPERITIPL